MYLLNKFLVTTASISSAPFTIPVSLLFHEWCTNSTIEHVIIINATTLTYIIPEDAIFAYGIFRRSAIRCINKCDHSKSEPLSIKFAPSITARKTKSKSKKCCGLLSNRHGELCCTLLLLLKFYVLLTITTFRWWTTNLNHCGFPSRFWIFEFFGWILCVMEPTDKLYCHKNIIMKDYIRRINRNTKFIIESTPIWNIL